MTLPGRNEDILEAAYALLRGELRNDPVDHKNEPPRPYFCLAMVRVVIERAFWKGAWRWYDGWRIILVDKDKRASRNPYARDMEASLRDLGQALILPRRDHENPDTGAVDRDRYVDINAAWNEGQIAPGDLAFRWDVVKDANGVWIGHVGIVMPGKMVLENTPGRPGALGRGATYLGALGSWPVTSVIRFDPDRR